MARPTRTAKLPPAPRQELKSWDEHNIGRLGLISIQERLPPTHTRWEVDFLVDGRPARLTCDAVAQWGGVPHGLDNDISNAVIELYMEDGAPEHGYVHTTGYGLLTRAGLDTSGRYYKSMKSSLYRLRTTTYSASEAWYDVRRRWTTVTFNYLSDLEYTSEGDGNLSGGSVIKVRLADPIVRSIRAQFVKPLDRGLWQVVGVG